MDNLILKIVKDNRDILLKQNEEEGIKLLFEIIKKWHILEKIEDTHSDYKYPSTEWYDWYDVMEAIKNDGYKVLSEVWDWPYYIIACKDDKLLEYIERDIKIYKILPK